MTKDLLTAFYRLSISGLGQKRANHFYVECPSGLVVMAFGAKIANEKFTPILPKSP